MKKDLSSLDRNIMQPLSRDIDDAFSDGIDCVVKIMGGNALRLYGSDDTTYNSIYTDGSGNLVIPAETSTTYNDDVALNLGSDSDVAFTWISATPYLYLSCTADGTELRIGNATLDFDVTWYAGANTVVFNEGNSDVTFNGVDLSLEDSDHLYLGDSNDVDISYDSADLQILPATDADGMVFGDNTHGWTITVYGGSTSQSFVLTGGATNTAVFDDIDVQLGTNDILGFGDSASPGDVYMRYDGTDFDILGAADDKIIKFGNGTNSFDIWIYGDSTADNIIFDASENILNIDGIDVQLEDDDYLYFGDSKDVTMRWVNTGGFQIYPAADGADFVLGKADYAWDFIWYGEAITNFVKFLKATNLVSLDAVDLQFGDDDILSFGDTAAPGDVYMRWDNVDFDVLCAADGTIIKLGNGTLDFDIWWYAGSDTVKFDEGNADITFNGVDLSLEDNDHLYLGDSNDVDMYFNAANDFYILPGTDLDNIYLGSTAGDKSWDIIWTGDGAANTVNFGVAANTITLAAVDITMTTTDQINFRDTSTYIQSDAAGAITVVSTGNIYLDSPIVKRKDPTTTNSTNAITLVATTSNSLQFFDTCGQTVVLTLPTLATSAGISYSIQNYSTAGALTINDTGASLIASIAFDEMGSLVCDGTTWGVIVGGPST